MLCITNSRSHEAVATYADRARRAVGPCLHCFPLPLSHLDFCWGCRLGGDLDRLISCGGVYPPQGHRECSSKGISNGAAAGCDCGPLHLLLGPCQHMRYLCRQHDQVCPADWLLPWVQTKQVMLALQFGHFSEVAGFKTCVCSFCKSGCRAFALAQAGAIM